MSKLSSKLKEKEYYLVRIEPSWGKIGQFYNDELYVVTSIAGTVMEENDDEYQYSCDSPECFISKISEGVAKWLSIYILSPVGGQDI